MGALASIESISLRSGRVLTESAHKEFERSYLVFRASFEFFGSAGLRLNESPTVPFQTEAPPTGALSVSFLAS